MEKKVATPEELKSEISKSCKLSIAEFSDIHLGHKSTPTTLTVKCMREALPDNAETAALDFIFLAGDVFDRLLNLPDEEAYTARAWVNNLLRLAKKYNIRLRVLEGTPSHDWRQSNMFEEVNRIADINADLRYVDTLSIVYEEDFDMYFLYVPDEWRPDPNTTWEEVQVLLKTHSLEQVDFCIMHGYFPHQLPAVLAAQAHNQERYESITKHAIFIGHVHKFSQVGKIYSAGSTNRLTHGEEEPKGHIRYKLYEDGSHEAKFVESKSAMIYKSIDCKGLASADLLERVKEEVEGLPKGSAVRLVATKADDASVSLKYFKELYRDFLWSVKITDTGSKVSEDLVLPKVERRIVKVTKENLVHFMVERIKTKWPDHLERCQSALERIMKDDSA